MTSTGGPGELTGPVGPGLAHDLDDLDDLDDGTAAALDDRVARVPAVAARTLQALAGAVQAGQLTPHAATHALVEDIAAGGEFDPTRRAELVELLTDLVTNDPYLAARVGRR